MCAKGFDDRALRFPVCQVQIRGAAGEPVAAQLLLAHIHQTIRVGIRRQPNAVKHAEQRVSLLV
jgi:hypothetical protein